MRKVSLNVEATREQRTIYVLHDLLFSRQRCRRASVRVSVAFGHEQRNEVDPRPCLFPVQLPAAREFFNAELAIYTLPTYRFSRLPCPTL